MAKEPRITRAREDGQAEAGVKRCADLMVEGLWRSGKSTIELAGEFGVSPRTVETWAQTASRAIRMAMGDGEAIRGRLAAMLERHEAVAMERQGYTMAGEAYPNPDVKAATGAVKALAEVLGVVETKHKVDVTVQTFAQLPPPAMLAKVREQIAELKRLETQLADQVEAIPALPVGDDDE